MKNYLKCWFIVILLFTTRPEITNAQTNFTGWQIGANVGFLVYQGDLTPFRFGSYKTITPTFGINITKILTPSFKLRTSFSLGQIKGDESKYVIPAFRQQRNLSFSTPVAEISEILVWNFLENGEDLNYKLFSPYIFAGIGVNFLNINRNSSNINPDFLLNEPQAAIGLAQDLKTTLPNSILVLPVGFGIEFFLSPTISLNAEFNFRYTRTDYIDGFSKVGASKGNDYYYTNSIGIIFKFGKKEMLGCPFLK